MFAKDKQIWVPEIRKMEHTKKRKRVKINFSYVSANEGEESYNCVITTNLSFNDVVHRPLKEQKVEISLPRNFKVEPASYVSESEECGDEEGSNLLIDCDLDDLSCISGLDDFDNKESYDSHAITSRSINNVIQSDFLEQKRRKRTLSPVGYASECPSFVDETESESEPTSGFGKVIAPIENPTPERCLSMRSKNCQVDVVSSSQNYHAKKRKRDDVQDMLLNLASSTIKAGSSRTKLLKVLSLQKRKPNKVKDVSYAMKTISTKQTKDRLALIMQLYKSGH